jgi:hypothetical protein
MRECVDEDGLLDWSEATAADSLQHAKEDEQPQRWSEAAEKRTQGEEQHADHVVALPAESAAEPCRKRKYHSIRNQIAG